MNTSLSDTSDKNESYSDIDVTGLGNLIFGPM